MAPTPTAPSMASAIEQFLIEQKKRKKTSTKANASSAEEAEKSDSNNIPPAEDKMTSLWDENTPKEQEKGQLNH
jgi:hypothetical protein